MVKGATRQSGALINSETGICALADGECSGYRSRNQPAGSDLSKLVTATTLGGSGERKDGGQRPLRQPLEVAERTIAAEVRRTNRNRAAERKRITAALREIERGAGDPRDEAHPIEELHNARDRVVPERPFSVSG